tara:strand:- start:5037 stop:6896 length:1860 start_codon:yes stop_codon:yes gene_type:complete
MANRFPLIVNPDTKEIQEIAQNDNLDLTGNGVYAGGSLGQNGQVLTTNGATVEWRTVTGGGGGGSGIDSDTTYIIESEDQADGASVNLVAGGSGVGTIKVKFADSGILQFNTTDNQTITTDAVDGSITNNKLQNSSIQFTVGGVVSDVALGGSITIPTYGDVFLSAAQTITNKTFENCTMSLAVGTGNNLVNIPNSSLLNNKIVINGTDVPLGGSINIAGGGGTVVNYNISAEDTPNSNESYIRLTGSDASTDNVTLKGGDRISITRNQDTITITNTEANTDTNTDTTYSINTDTLISNNSAVGARLNLVAGGDGVGANQTDRINLRGGTGVTITSLSDSDIQFSLPQDVSTSSNVAFNDVTVQGSLNVQGALTYIDTTNLRVVDKTIEIGDGITSSLLADGAGILIGTSNINWRYTHSTTAWTSTSDVDLVPTKSYKIGGTEVLNSNRVLGKTLPVGSVVGTSDQQSLTNKTIVSPVMSSIINTGTVYFPQPTIADTLVGRNTSDTLTNKVINGNNNTIQDIGNSSIVNSYMVINGVTRNLGDTFTVESQDPYNDEKAQDTVAGMITSATHSGISWNYDDTVGTLAATVNETIDLTTLQSVVAASTDFADFKTRIAAL